MTEDTRTLEPLGMIEVLERRFHVHRLPPEPGLATLARRFVLTCPRGHQYLVRDFGRSRVGLDVRSLDRSVRRRIAGLTRAHFERFPA